MIHPHDKIELQHSIHQGKAITMDCHDSIIILSECKKEQHFQLEIRYEIQILKEQKLSGRTIAKVLRRTSTTVGKELKDGIVLNKSSRS